MVSAALKLPEYGERERQQVQMDNGLSIIRRHCIERLVTNLMILLLSFIPLLLIITLPFTTWSKKQPTGIHPKFSTDTSTTSVTLTPMSGMLTPEVMTN